MERSTQELILTQQQEQNLYGVRYFLAAEHAPETIREYVEAQEKAHLAEGLEIQQRSVRMLEYDGSHVLGFGGQPMVDVNRSGYRDAKKQFLSGDQAVYYLMKRREHDVTISECTDALMADGQVGDVIMVASPYQEEVDDQTARRLGYWPEYRRSYIWLYRKKNEHELECTDISIDQSSVATYKQLFADLGVTVAPEAQSHDVPAYLVQLYAGTERERAVLAQQLIDRYSVFNQDPEAQSHANAFEAVDFLDKQAGHYLKLVVDVHQAIADSLETGNLHDLVKLSASRALKTLTCLSREEMQELHSLLSADFVDARHERAFSMLIAAQRYGVWEGVSKLVGGVADSLMHYSYSADSTLYQALLLEQIYKNTNSAAEQYKTMPGCAGGTSFLQENQEAVKTSTFSNERYSFNKEMYCVVCQAPPKEGAKKKMCGPCGICRSCDTKLKSKIKAA